MPTTAVNGYKFQSQPVSAPIQPHQLPMPTRSHHHRMAIITDDGFPFQARPATQPQPLPMPRPIAHECRRIPNGYEILLFRIPNVSPTSVMAKEIYQIFLFRESLTHFKDAFSPPTSSVASRTTQGYLAALSSFCKEQTLDKSGSAFEFASASGTTGCIDDET